MAASHTRYPTFNLKHLSGGIDNVILKRSIYEAIETCRKSGVPFIVSHITDMSQADSTAWAMETIDKAVKEGLPLAGDIIGHDFLANEFFILTFKGKIPAPVMMKLGNYTMDQFYAGRDIYVDGKLFVKKYGQVTLEEAEYLRKNVEKIDGFGEGFLSLPMICKIMPPEDTIRALKYPWVFMGNDAGGQVIDPATGEPVANMPRDLGTFSRLLGHWSREEKALTLHQALFKATIAPALWLGLDKKGRLQEGCDADIVIFDPATIIDRAGWLGGTENLKPDGISHVIVGGQVVVENNRLTGATPGRLIRRTWTIPGDTAALINLYQTRFSVR
jgi:N-acyl-D-amino-acid deacylase